MKGKGQYVRQHEKTVPELENTPPAVLTRLKFWETDRIFKCPLIGMCLKLEEQKKLLKKTTFAVKKASPFAIHEALVSCADSENHLSRRVDSLMNRKFGEVESTLRDLEPSEFVERFKTAFESGDYEGHLWAAAVHPDLPDKAKRELFGEFHMSMHFNAEDRANLQRKWYLQKTETDDLRVKLETETRLRRSAQKENERLQRQISNLMSELAASAKEKERLEEEMAGKRTAECVRELDSERQELAAELERMAARVEDVRKRETTAEKENKRLSAEIDSLKEANERYKEEIREIFTDFSALNHCNSQCPAFDLCQKRVLIVGGLTKMESLYRELIESSGGVFEYHDGYMKKGVKQLESRLRRADVVICPVTCNSHAACSLVKNLAKKHRKKVHMLDNSSLNAVSQAIRCGDSHGGCAAGCQ